MTSIKKSRCLTCSKTNNNGDAMANAEAAQHQDRYPDHHVQLTPDEDCAEKKTPRRVAQAILIPLGLMQATGASERITQELYESYLAARLAYNAQEYDIIWPAQHDAEGFYQVPE